jgi:NADP-dependent 3-hydroxy acid dehydrogenase YdfG
MDGFRGKVAAVTGAGSGIGQALAVELARSGAKLAISDVDTDGLAETEAQLRAIGAAARSDRLDVTQREAFLSYADEVNGHFGMVNQIYNIAGIGYLGDVEVVDFKDIERVIDVDLWGVVNGTKAFLPHLIASGDGHIVNMSSMMGLLAVPSGASYCAAKFAVRGFSEALRQEMMLAGHPVAVTVVCPGVVKTPIGVHAGVAPGVDKAKAIEALDKMSLTSAPRAARLILKAVAKHKARVLVGPDARAVDLIARLVGPGYQRLMLPVSKRLQFKSG